MDTISFIGAGRLGATLARAFARCGLPVAMIASRQMESARRVAQVVPGCAAVSGEEAARADLVFLTVPDDAIGALAAQWPWRADQAVVHCSGATELAVLAPAQRGGAEVGGFHPLQIFSDPDAALDLLPGSSVAIQAEGALDARLRDIAQRLQMHPLTLPPGARALYHGGASFAASFLLSMLDEAVMPLAQGTLAAAARKGLAGALAGPVSRGDVGVLRRHLAALDALGLAHAAFYREMTSRQLRLAQASGRLAEAQLQSMRAALQAP